MDWDGFFFYTPADGVLRWKVKRPGPKSPAVGEPAGSIIQGRYRSIQVSKKRYYVHRVIWEMMVGPIPDGLCIDHVDGNGLNNRLQNLRLTTLSGNQRNRQVSKNSRTGVPGVNHHSNNRGYSVHCAGKYVGYSEDFSAAVAMRKASEKLNNYHPNHGRTKQC